MTHYYAELFAGAGGMSMGLEAAGFVPFAHAEIYENARAVLRYRWPGVRLDGDVSQINGADYAGCTLISGGSPCQDLSLAGRRAGLGGARSSLFYQQVRIWNESGAPYLLWENVHGALSSNGGKDFAEVLSALVGANVDVPVVGRGKSAKQKWQRAGVASGPAGMAAWRVLDLRYVAGRYTPAPPQRRARVFVLAARTGAAGRVEDVLIEAGGCWHPCPREQAKEVAANMLGSGNAAGALTPRIKLAVECPPCEACGEPWCDDCSEHYAECACPGPHSDDEPVGMRVARMVAFGEYTVDGTASAIKARDYKDATDLVYTDNGSPRRLTPKESERLMSWPDDHTRYGEDENGTVYALSDSARYKLCGNGVGSTCAEWIGSRLLHTLTRDTL